MLRRSAQEALVGGVFFPALNGLLNRRGIRSTYRNLLTTEHWSCEQLAELQLRKLRALVAHAYEHIPFYRSRFADAGFHPAEIQSVQDLERVPPLTREEVVEHHRDMVDIRLRPYIQAADTRGRSPGAPIPLARFRRNRLIRNMSSGSTGTPTVFYEDGSRTALNWALDLRHRSWFGIPPGVREARMARGRRDLSSGSRMPRIREALWNQLMLPGMNLTRADYVVCLQELERFRPRVLWGITSAWVGLAEYIESHKVSLGSWRPSLAITWAAPLYDHERDLLKGVFQCPITNVYGSREVGHVASRCPDDSLHIHDEHFLVEVEPHAPHTGSAMGEILCTPLDISVMPFIRYRIGDLGTLSESPCTCGRAHHVLDELLGRVGEVHTTQDGRMLSPNWWAFMFMSPELGGSVRRFQVIYQRNGCMLIRIVRGSDYDAGTERSLRHRLEKSLGPTAELKFAYVDAIAPMPSGKHQLVVRE